MNKVLLLGLLGLAFYMLDKYKYPCKKKVSLEHNILHYLHNVTAVLIYLGPFIFKDQRILYALLLGTIGLIVQGIINPNKEQCIWPSLIFNFRSTEKMLVSKVTIEVDIERLLN